MKKLLFCSFAVLVFVCSKSNEDTPAPTPPNYLGVYTSTNKDTVKVTQNGDYVKFVYTSFESIHTPIPAPTTPHPTGNYEAQYQRTYDSVRVAADLSFTDNEIYTSYTHYTGSVFPLPASSSFNDTNVGVGTFGNDVVAIQFNTLTFNGVKL